MARVEGIWYPWGGGTIPDLPPVDQIPHLTLTRVPSTNLSSWDITWFSVYKSQRLAWENSNCLLRHVGRPLVSL